MKAALLALARRGVPLVGAGAMLGLGVTLAAQRRAAVEPEPECSCWPTPESEHYVYYGITEPGSATEWNPECEVHRRCADCGQRIDAHPDGYEATT